MNAVMVPLGKNILEELVSHLNCPAGDYSSNLVVFPGKRPLHFLRRSLALKGKRSFIPPQGYSMDEFISYVYSEILRNRCKGLETIDATVILYEIHKQAYDGIGSGGFPTFDAFFPVGLKIYQALEELFIEGVTPHMAREIGQFTEEKMPEKTLKNLRSLSYFYEAFYKRMGQTFSTRSMRYRTVSEDIREGDFGSFEKIIFAGFFALTGSERDLFKKLLKWNNSLFIFQDGPGMKEKLSSLGINAECGCAERKPQIYYYKSPDTHGQVFGVGGILKEYIENKVSPDERTLIVLPSSETLFPLYHQVLGLLGPGNYNISMGYPLSRTPVYGFFNSLMHLISSMDGDRLYVPDYLSFVLHPYTKNIYFQGRADITRMLFHAIEEVLAGQRTKKFLTLSEIEEDKMISGAAQRKILKAEPGINMKGLLEHLRDIHRETIKKMLAFNNVGDFLLKATGVLTYIYENSTAQMHPFFFPYSEAFITHLDAVVGSLLKEIQFSGTLGYFTFFRKYLNTCHVPFAGTPLKGVQVLGFLETRNLKFERIFFLDLNEDIIPDTNREDSILPFPARRTLGLPTYIEREELMEYYFQVLIGGAREVHIFYVENDRKVRSRFVEKLIWNRQKRENKRNDGDYIKSVRYSVRLKSSLPAPIGKTDTTTAFLRDFVFSASALDLYLKCPLQFYYRHVLNISRKYSVQDELEKADIGIFVHDVLKTYFDGKKGAVLTERDMDVERMGRVVDDLFEKGYGRDPVGETYLLRRQIKRHLREFIENYQIPMLRENDVTIVDLEKKIEVNEDLFRLVARLDRVEKRGDRTIIMDYKTSADNAHLKINFDKLEICDRKGWKEAIGTLQLPFYQLAYSTYLEAKGERTDNIDCMFLLLGKARLGADIEAPLFPPTEKAAGRGRKSLTGFTGEDNIREKYGMLCEVISSLLKEITDPEQLFIPTATPKDNCSGCEYRYICANQD